MEAYPIQDGQHYVKYIWYTNVYCNPTNSHVSL